MTAVMFLYVYRYNNSRYVEWSCFFFFFFIIVRHEASLFTQCTIQFTCDIERVIILQHLLTTTDQCEADNMGRMNSTVITID